MKIDDNDKLKQWLPNSKAIAIDARIKISSFFPVFCTSVDPSCSVCVRGVVARWARAARAWEPPARARSHGLADPRPARPAPPPTASR